MYILTFRHLVQEDSRIPKINPLEIQSWLKFVYTYLPKVNYELDLESIQDGPSLESSSNLNVTLRYLGPWDLGDPWTLEPLDLGTWGTPEPLPSSNT